MMKHLKSILTLFAICAIVSIALAVCYEITAPIILERQQAAASGALLEVMPDGGEFEKVDISSYSLPATIKEAHKASNGGYVFQVEFAGFNPGNVAMIGVSADGKVTGTKVITNTESSGYGADHLPALDSKNHYKDADVSTIDTVDTVAGCTVSTKAYRAVVKDALNAATILGGGSVDLRDPAQILNDNLNAALGTEGVEFDKHFFAEVVEGVDAIYTAKTGEGHVVVIGEEFIGVDADGNVIGEANEVAANAIATIKATTFTELDLSTLENVSIYIVSAQLTNDGIYVVEVKADGYGIKGDHYVASGKNIYIKVSVLADGTILDCYTISQEETPKYGDACENEEFYGQFDGKTKDDYSNIDAITGATITTNGYKEAIGRVFEFIEILKGGAN